MPKSRIDVSFIPRFLLFVLVLAIVVSGLTGVMFIVLLSLP